MFTMQDLADVDKFLQESYELPYYSPEQNDLCYELSRVNPVCRSERVEVLVMKEFERNGYNVYRMGGLKKKYDIWVNDERIEVKSSLAAQHITRKGHTYYTYSFPGIKPECFHRLVLAYVTPTGIELNILTRRAVYARIRNGNLTRGHQGYTFGHGKSCRRAIGQKFSNFVGVDKPITLV